jgi:dihydrofolate synthase / folylpolyglutamate synthase
VVTVLALRHFAASQCDLVVWETGMGGRLDATNIVLPLASVITNVQLDHQRWLGATLPEIAREKAGIIKPGVPVITAEQKPEVLQVLSRIASEQGAPLVRVTPEDTRRSPLNLMKLPLTGDHQLLNAALACATVQQLQPALPVAVEDLRIGLQHVKWPGRMQVFHRGIGRTIILDGAHNPAGAEALMSALAKNFPGTLPTFIFAVMQDKDWGEMCRIIMPGAGRICLTQVQSDRAESPAALRDFCQQINPYAEALVCGSLGEALTRTEHDSLVVITGSLQFVGEAIEQLGLSPAPASNERGLNDYAPAAR